MFDKNAELQLNIWGRLIYPKTYLFLLPTFLRSAEFSIFSASTIPASEAVSVTEDESPATDSVSLTLQII